MAHMGDAGSTVAQPPEAGHCNAPPGSRPHRVGAWLLVGSWALLLMSWVFSNPPGYGPDEPAHYIKAIGVGRGELSGSPGQFDVGPGFGPEQLRWINQNTRAIDVPGGLAPDGLPCSAVLDPTVSAGCVTSLPPSEPGPRLTYVGTYQPYLYILPGVMTRFARTLGEGIVLARLAGAATSLALLGAAVALLNDRGQGRLSMVGPVAAVTPMVIFLGSAISANGTEVAASICYLAGVLGLTRPNKPPPWAWMVVAVAGAVLALSRSLGPGFVILGALLPLALISVRGAWSALRRGGWWSVGTMAILAAGMAGGVGWELLRQGQPDVEATDASVLVDAARSVFGYLLRQQVGVFGWNEVPLPEPAFALWVIGLVGLVGLALIAGSRRARLGMVLTVVVAVVTSMAVFAAVRRTGFPMQGRYVLPVMVAIPMLAGEILFRHRQRLSSQVQAGILLAATVAAGAVQVTAWVVTARRSAVGVTGPLFFSGQSQWQPPLGWGLWAVATLVGGLLMVAAGLALSRPAHELPQRGPQGEGV